MVAPMFHPLTTYREFPPAEMKQRAKAFRDEMQRRRTVRVWTVSYMADECGHREPGKPVQNAHVESFHRRLRRNA